MIFHLSNLIPLKLDLFIHLGKPMGKNTQHQKKPWYKQFWPWFLIALPSAAVIASVSTVFFAFKHADVIVQDNYYKQGLAINTQVHDLQVAEDLGLTAKLLTNNSTLTIQLQHTNNAFVEPEKLVLSLIHPLDDKQDIQITALNAGNLSYRATLPALKSSKWHIDLEGQNQQDSWRLKGHSYYPQQTVYLTTDSK